MRPPGGARSLPAIMAPWALQFVLQRCLDRAAPEDRDPINEELIVAWTPPPHDGPGFCSVSVRASDFMAKYGWPPPPGLQDDGAWPLQPPPRR